MATYSWRGHEIEVELRPFAVSWWMFAGFVVTVDGRRFCTDPDMLGLTSRATFLIEHEGVIYDGAVEPLGPVLFLPRMAYCVSVQGEEVRRGRQAIKRWYVSCAVGAALLIVLSLAMLGALAFLSLVHQWAAPG
jgi:hypothetical protein